MRTETKQAIAIAGAALAVGIATMIEEKIEEYQENKQLPPSAHTVDPNSIHPSNLKLVPSNFQVLMKGQPPTENNIDQDSDEVVPIDPSDLIHAMRLGLIRR
jgi:hypothetical protein